MKTKNADELITKVIIIAVAVILVGLLIYWVMNVYKDNKRDADSATQKINSANQSMAEFDLLVYDNASITGEALKDLIAELNENKAPVAIQVITLAHSAGATYNYDKATGNSIALSPTPFPTNKTNTDYITPTANFVGEVVKNSNDEIDCIKFTQQP